MNKNKQGTRSYSRSGWFPFLDYGGRSFERLAAAKWTVQRVNPRDEIELAIVARGLVEALPKEIGVGFGIAKDGLEAAHARAVIMLLLESAASLVCVIEHGDSPHQCGGHRLKLIKLQAY